MPNFYIPVDEDFHAKVKIYCAKNKKRITTFVIEAIKEQLKKER